MWSVSESMRRWHEAITDLWTHTAFWDACQTAEKWDHARRCAEGQTLYHAEQHAYASHISDQYGQEAVA